MTITDIDQDSQSTSVDYDQRPLVLINSTTQTLEWHCVDSDKNITYPISTALNGLGNQQDSFKTPMGMHNIKQKIGQGQPQGMVFIGREATGSVADDMNNTGQDEITTRILRLDGMEPGVNKGGDQDSYSRYIYIHGTSDEARIGQAVSAGCIRMKNRDVIELFDGVEVGDLVLIT